MRATQLRKTAESRIGVRAKDITQTNFGRGDRVLRKKLRAGIDDSDGEMTEESMQ